jgi:3-isopropylmalate/(R)-2-methylmalate dehydratase large subunit
MGSATGIREQKNGIVHVVGPENGITLPGATIVCDSHTSTTVPLVPLLLIGTSGRNGPFYAMYHATKPRKMLIHVAGDLQLGVTPKTLHYISSQNYPLQATGYFVEYAGKVLKT